MTFHVFTRVLPKVGEGRVGAGVESRKGSERGGGVELKSSRSGGDR